LSKVSSAGWEAVNWRKWSQRESAQLWEAVALSIDIEPECLPINWRPADYSDPFEECPSEFKDRIDIAVDHAENGALQLLSRASSRPSRSTVRLPEFADWAGLLGWCLPAQFPRKSSLNSVRAPGGAGTADAAERIEQSGHGTASRIRSGTAGRPSKGKHLIEDEFERRAAAGQVKSTLPEEAQALLDWYKGKYPKEERPTLKTISNNIRPLGRGHWAKKV
jgi:hypothetical protein